MATEKGWYGVDLDGTLAVYDRWRGHTHIGTPIPRMIARVKAMLALQLDVRIFTARISGLNDAEVQAAKCAIDAWCVEHLGVKLPLTCKKDYGMVKLYDDRCEQVIPNTGGTVMDLLTRARDIITFAHDNTVVLDPETQGWAQAANDWLDTYKELLP